MAVYVGWSSKVTRPQFLPKAKAPANYKDPEKIAAFVEKKNQEIATTAGMIPIAAQVISILAIDDLGQVVFTGNGSSNLAKEFIDWLTADVERFPVVAENADVLAAMLAFELWQPDQFNQLNPEAAAVLRQLTAKSWSCAVDPYKSVKDLMPDFPIESESIDKLFQLPAAKTESITLLDRACSARDLAARALLS